MTSAITIGRMGLDIETPSLTSWEDDGNQVNIEGVNWALGVAEGRALRQQILGLAQTVDPQYLTSADDPHRDGYYRVLGATVTSEDLLTTDGHISWAMTLERPLNFAGLRPELLLSGTDRPGIPGTITAKHWVGIPEGYGFGQRDGSPSLGAIYLIGGERMTIVSSADFDPRNSILMTGDPANHYLGAATTKMGGYAVIGRQTLRNPTDWELSNELVRVTPGTSDSAIFTIEASYVASTVSYEIELGRYTGGSWSPGVDHTVTSVQVLRETVEEQVLRISGVMNLDSSAYPRNAYTVDLSLRRGALGVDVVYLFAENDTYGLGWVSAVASTTISAANTGFYKTTADADGLNPVIVHPPSGFLGAFTRDLTNGRAYFTAFGYNTAAFFVGIGDQDYADYDAADQQSAYFSTVRARQRMVAP